MNAGEILNDSAALLNDIAKDTFTNDTQIPYLNIALQELQEEFELNNIPATNEVSAVIPVTAGTATKITTAIPTRLVEIQKLLERTTGTTEPFIEMTRVEYLPELEITQTLSYWTWQNQEIRFLGSLSNRDVKINYIQSLFGVIDSASDPITLINSKSFLAFQTAGLCAEFIYENITRAMSLYGKANRALERSLGISTKGRQAIATRRRPFMSQYKTRSLG